MHTKTTAALVFGFLAFFTPSLDASASPLTTFAGSRAEVRAFCDSDGRFLLEGGSYSYCLTATTDVMCTDDGLCKSSDPVIALVEGFGGTARVADAVK